MRTRSAMTLFPVLLPFFGAALAQSSPPLEPPAPATETTIANTPTPTAPLTRADL